MRWRGRLAAAAEPSRSGQPLRDRLRPSTRLSRDSSLARFLTVAHATGPDRGTLPPRISLQTSPDSPVLRSRRNRQPEPCQPLRSTRKESPRKFGARRSLKNTTSIRIEPPSSVARRSPARKLHFQESYWARKIAAC